MTGKSAILYGTRTATAPRAVTDTADQIPGENSPALMIAQKLDIAGYGGRNVPNMFLPHGDGSSHLAIMFPGRAYGPQLPLLFYTSRVLRAKGADLFAIDYTEYTSCGEDDEIERRLSADVPAALAAVLARRPYRRITLLGKSLGTIVMGRLIPAEPRLRGAECIWMTPLLHRQSLRAQIAGTPHRALFIVGTADDAFDRNHLAELENATGGEILVIEGANHSLEIPGDVRGSIRVLERVVDAVDRFAG